MTYKVTEEALAHGNVCTIFLDGEIDMDVVEKAKEVIFLIIILIGLHGQVLII